MHIPKMPYVPIDMDDETRSFLESLEGRIDRIDVARVEGDTLYVLGYRGRFLTDWYSEITRNRISGEVSETSFKDTESVDTSVAYILTLGLYSLAPNIRQRRKLGKNYNRKVEQYRKANLEEIQNKVKDIRVYQGTIDEVQNELRRPLERIETGEPETFIQGDDTFWLRVSAYLLGADAVVHYQPGSSIGTPVKYIDKSK